MHSGEQEWAALYDTLLHFFGRLGENDYLGEKDYWVVDDDWGEFQQKVCIQNPDILTPGLIEDLKEILRTEAPKWAIILDICFPNCPSGGVIVSATNVDYQWDLGALRHCLSKPKFFEGA